MIKDSKTNPVAIMTNHIQAKPISGPSPISTNPSPSPLRTALRRLVMLIFIICFCGGAWGQSLYVIHNGSNYLSHNATTGAVNTTATSTFSPTTCFWTITTATSWGTTYYFLRPVDSDGNVLGNLYLRPRSGNNTYSLNTSTSTDYANWNGLSDGGQPYYNRYLRLNGSTWQVNNTNSNRGTLRLVTVTSISTSYTNPTISGADVLTAQGNSNYTASNAAYQVGGYTNYKFNSNDHFFNGNTAITPVAANIAYTWELSDNDYATLTTSNGSPCTINVASLPESDITLTITVTATASGGTPAVPSGTTLSATKEITILGTKPSAPTINVSGTNVTISSSATGTTSIRYTLDGTDPTSTSGTVYTGAIDLSGSTTSPVTIKAVTVRNGNASDVSEATVTLTLPEPAITVNGSAGTATISATSGATIYYTTDGSNPTTSSSQYSGGLSGLDAMTTIKAIAVKTGWNNSPVASETITIPSGVSGGTVTIFDYEDHNWSYYQASSNLPDGYPTEYLSSPDPRNVKITYRGGSVSGASAVAISALDGEGQNEMIYYKTLEKTVPGMTGNYPYTVISNPFSKRPRKNNTTGTNGFYGFAGWKVIDGGEYISEYGDNDVLPLDVTIHFTGLDTDYTPNCTSGEIIFEATWTEATVSRGTSAPTITSGTYETNFWVLSGNPGNAVTVPANCTMTARYPDGSSSWDGSFTREITAGGNNSKVEWVNMNSTSNVDAAGYTFTMGRGIVNSGNGGTLYGVSSNKACENTVKIESGTYNNLYNFGNQISSTNAVDQLMILGCDYDRAKNDNNKLKIRSNMYVGSSIQLNRSSNSLYVRTYIKSGNFGSTVTVSGNNSYTGAGGSNTYYYSVSGTHNAGRRYLCMEGGRIDGIAGGMDETNSQTTTDRAFDLRVRGTAQIDGVVYGAAEFAGARGTRTLIFTGGTINGWIAAGANGTRTDGGQLNGASYLYFGGKATAETATSNQVMNRAVGGNVFGAGCGYSGSSSSGQVQLGTNVVVADESYVERGVYGGGSYGYTTSTSKIFILGGHVEGKDGGVSGTTYSASITGGVFGGACQNQGGTVNITMTGGKVEGGVYGGSNATGTLSGSVTMKINGGQVGTSSSTANIHGGGYGNSTTVSGNVTMTIGSSTSATDWAKVYGNVYGGSALGTVNGNATITMNKGEIYGNLFGGALGDNTYAAQVGGNVTVTVNGGKVTGAVFGCNDANGTPKGTVTVTINGTDATTRDGNGNKIYALQGVYGGGNLAHYNPTTATNGYPKVIINNCSTSIKDVYGGGNAAAVPQTDVTINGGDIGRVFAGGNGESGTPANVGYQNKLEPTTANSYGNGTASAKIYGGTIVQVFGGSNAHGVIRQGGSIDVDKSKATGGYDCDLIVKEIYGGGNEAAGAAGAITIGCTGALTNNHSEHPENIGVTLEGIGSVYGGANKAGVSNNIVLNINSGIVGNVFGGNNQTGTISGTITVNIEKTNSSCGWYVGNVFGGGNLAEYSGNPKVNIKNGTVSGNVYGGGNGDPNDGTQMKGSTAAPTVIIGDLDSNHSTYQAIVLGDVYGGGNAAKITGSTAPKVRVLNKANTEIKNVYGGGNAADVPATDVIIDAGTISGNVFGGGHGDKASLNDLEGESGHSDKEANVTGNTSVQIRGGIINKVYAGSNLNGKIGGNNCTLNIAKSDTTRSPMKITEVYGGGNMADGNATSITIGCTGAWTTSGANNHSNANDTDNRIGYELEGIGTVYGGANQANIGTAQNTSNIVLSINSGMVANVYGGNNTSGVINGTIQVNINKTSDACGWYVGNVFGGGNLADYSGTPDVNIQNGTVSGSVFGGGNAADVGGSDVSVSGGQVNGSVYGGCNSSGDAGAVTISLTGGQIGTSGTRADVYGGGFGQNTTTSGNIGVTLNGTTVYGDLYGGSALGSVNNASANPANTTTLTISSNTLHGTIYGGGKGDVAGQEGHSNVTATSNGNVEINYNTTNTNLTGIYGGANINGLVVGDIVVNVKGDVGTNADPINVFGGGLGAPTSTNGSVTVNVGLADGTNAPTIYGDVYGGSALGTVNDGTGDLTTINILNGTVHGNIYGGGLGDATLNSNGYLNTEEPTVEAIVNGTVHVNIGHETNTNSAPTIDGKVFGCNNLAGTPKGNVYVDVYRTAHTTANSYPDPAPTTIASMTDQAAYAIQEVYGGGNLAHYTTTLEGASTHVHIHNCDNTIQYVYGGGNAANTPATSVIIDGGRFNYVFGGGNGAGTGNPGANVAGNSNVTLNGGIIDFVFGGSNTLGVVNGVASIGFNDPAKTCTRLIKELYGGGNMAPGGSVDLTIPCGVDGLNLVYGGSRNADIGTETLFNGGTKKNVTLTIEGGNLAQVFGGNNQGGVIWGDVTLNLVGGTIVDAYGGNNAGGNVKGSITVNVIDAESSTCPLTLTNVFGGGKDAAYTPADATISSPEVNIKHVKNGTSISGSVFGGGQGATADVTSNPVVTIGDDESNHYVTIAGNVYGGGDAAAVLGSTSVEMKNAHSTAANLFGGGNQAGVSGTASVTLTAGHVTTGIYGGCNTSGTVSGAIDVNINGGTTGTSATQLANVHGGGYGASTETEDDVTVTIGDGTSTPVIWGDVYGGSGFGNVNDASAEPAQTTKVWLRSGTINGSLYGGGLGQLGDNTTNPIIPDYPAYVNGNVVVIVDGGAVKTTTNTNVTTGSVFGCNNVNGTPKGTVEVTINSTAASTGSGENKVYALQGVYGGGNLAHYNPTTPDNYPTVTINGCTTSIKDVYGGGNAAAVPYTSVTVWGGDIDRVFAGGNGESGTPAHVGYMNTNPSPSANSYGTGRANATIYGGTINQIFGGSNANGVIRDASFVNISKDDAACAMHIGEVYGGGNFAAGNAGTITIGCTGGNGEGIGDVYGGANAAAVNNNITLNITGGSIQRVFGGNNSSGAISGTITVNVDWNGSCSNNYLGSVFGGGNQAAYGSTSANKGNYPVVNIKKANIANNVFGGGLGATAIVYGNPQVTIGNITTSKTVEITHDVYGGGDAAAVVGTPVVKVINNCYNEIGNVYGGGNAADVNGTDVTIDGGIIDTVFGGGHGNKNANPQKAANVNGDVSLSITGGRITSVFGGSNSKGDISGDITLDINKGDTSCEMHIGEVYGGGNEAAGNAGTITIGCTGGDGEGIGDLYGGANAANVNNDIELNITGGSIQRIFGGNNSSGAISGTITVNVDWNGSCTNNYLGSVFGGGNQAAYGGTDDNKGNYPVVNIKKADIANNVFGGGLGATAIVYGNPQVTIGNLTTSKTVDIAHDVYGGGDAAAVVGTPVVHVINNCYNEIGNVYGGGNAADVSGTDVTIDGGIIDTVFGGGHGNKNANPQKAANVNGAVSLSITGGTITNVFGGSNSKGNITGTITLDVNKGANSCEMHITELYGGGNEAAGNAGTISIGCTGDYEHNQEGIGDVYGGANAADVNNNIALTITGGHINRVFGGNNSSGSIAGTVQVNVNWDENSTCGDNYLGSVYGGGNQAPYGNSGNYPEVNIINGEVTNNVFGGGLGSTATVTANPYVHITGGSIGGNVFGGGDQAAVTGSTNVEINGSSVTVGGKAFGGGNNAGVSVNAVISLASGSVSGGVYGGCNTTGTIGGYTQVNVTGGTVGATNAHANVHGGGFGQGTAVSGNVTVNIGTDGAQTGATIYGDIYGGSAMGTVNTAYHATGHPSYETTTVNLYSGTIDGNVYGGGLGTSTIPAYVYGNAEVYQYGAILISRTEPDSQIANLQIPVSGMIFGCNNVNGTPKGHVKVVVYETKGTGQQDRSLTDRDSHDEADHVYDMLAVFGGGNKAAYEPDSDNETTEVIINGCNAVSIHSVYGGGNAASTPATSVSVSGAYEIEYVFGGGNGAGTGNPGANVGYKAYPESVAGANQISDRREYLYGTGIATTNIYGGRIHKVFGGSNTKGNVRNASVAMLDEISNCPLILDGFYGGGKSAYMEGKGDIHLGCVSGLDEIYGGAERADVGNNIVLTLTSGHYNKVYGGNNLSGMVLGSITINIEQTGCLPVTIGELFGGGNNAPYSVYGYNSDKSIKLPGAGVTRQYADPSINIRSCQSIGTIYGGGEGADATLVGNPHINVNIVQGWLDGQNQTYSTPQLLQEDGVIGTIFGGGKKANVIGDTYIFIADSSSVSMQSLKDLKAKINNPSSGSNSTITFGVTGSGSNESITYTVSGASEPSLTEPIIQTVKGATINGNIYGGGNEADITGSSNIKIGQKSETVVNPAPGRAAYPMGQSQQPTGQSEQPAQQPAQNAATESQQIRTVTPTRL